MRATALSSGLCVVINGQPARSLMPDAVFNYCKRKNGGGMGGFLPGVGEKKK